MLASVLSLLYACVVSLTLVIIRRSQHPASVIVGAGVDGGCVEKRIPASCPRAAVAAINFFSVGVKLGFGTLADGVVNPFEVV